MKHTSVVSLVLTAAAFVAVSCMVKHQYPSPLKGVSIGEQTLDYDETQRSIEVNSYMVNVQNRCIDTETGDVAMWLRAKTDRQRVDLELIENTTIYDRRARVVLFLDTDRDDVDKSVKRVEFYVTQKKSRLFDGLALNDLTFGPDKKDTTLVLPRKLERVKSEVYAADGTAPSWCSVHLSGDLLMVRVDQLPSAVSRQAIVRLLPTVNGSPADSITASLSFTITQQ